MEKKEGPMQENEASVNEKEELRTKYAEFLINEKINENYIMYEAFGGRGMTCSPFAIFKELMARAEFERYIHVWVIDDFEDNAFFMARYEKCRNVRFVKYQSLEYRKYLATCGYLINNVSFPGYFVKREGQIYLNTWHGISFKTVGFDIPSGRVSAGNSAKNFLSADYITAPNVFTTDIYKSAFKLEGLYEGTILQEGQPRTDSIFRTDRGEIMETLRHCGVEVDPSKKIILYAPTWKGSQYRSPDTDLQVYYELIRRIEKVVDTEKYQVLVKPHQIVYYHIKNTQEVTGQFIPATVDANELMAAVDVLISDYSSIYFDFLVTGKPILFFVPDLEDCINGRGFYFGIDKLPGPIARSFEELEELMRDPQKAMEVCAEKYRTEKQWACPHDDGSVCARVVERIFLGKISGNEVKCQRREKKKLLLFAGELEDDQTSAVVQKLLSHIDYTKFDVTVSAGGAGKPEVERRIEKLPPQVRVLYRNQKYSATEEEKKAHVQVIKYGLGREAHQPPVEMYKRELRRMFGESKFDSAMAFQNRPGLFLLLLVHMENTRRLLFLQGDLQEELVENKRLKLCASALPYADRIVCATKALMHQNRKKCTVKGSFWKFAYLEQTFDTRRLTKWS